jgi:sigma-B regulation protein RsbU (phosphoserine phosphatase)
VTDVSGKGVSSALLAALLQGAFLSSSEESMDIERLMQRINNFLNERTEGEKYATVFYCTIREDGTLRWANAGHCTPFLLRSDGEMQTLRTTGMPLGMLSIAQYEVEQVKLQAGDKIVAYSDGLSEAQNADCKFFEAARLRDVLRENAGLGCVDLLDKLMSEIDNFTEGAAQSDDMTAVVIEYHPADV